MTLFKIIKQKDKQVLIYGADSVTGLVLMQLLTRHTDINFIPHVRAISKTYLNERLDEYNIEIAPNIRTNSRLIIDLAGPAIMKNYSSILHMVMK